MSAGQTANTTQNTGKGPLLDRRAFIGIGAAGLTAAVFALPDRKVAAADVQQALENNKSAQRAITAETLFAETSRRNIPELPLVLSKFVVDQMTPGKEPSRDPRRDFLKSWNDIQEFKTSRPFRPKDAADFTVEVLDDIPKGGKVDGYYSVARGLYSIGTKIYEHSPVYKEQLLQDQLRSGVIAYDASKPSSYGIMLPPERALSGVLKLLDSKPELKSELAPTIFQLTGIDINDPNRTLLNNPELRRHKELMHAVGVLKKEQKNLEGLVNGAVGDQKELLQKLSEIRDSQVEMLSSLQCNTLEAIGPVLDSGASERGDITGTASSERSVSEVEREIESQRYVLSVAASAARHFGDPKTIDIANKTEAVGMACLLIKEAHNAFTVNKTELGMAVLTCNYLQAGLMVASAFQKQQDSPEMGMLKHIAKMIGALFEEMREFRKEMREHFKGLSRQVTALHETVQSGFEQVLEGIRALHNSVQGVHRAVEGAVSILHGVKLEVYTNYLDVRREFEKDRDAQNAETLKKAQRTMFFGGSPAPDTFEDTIDDLTIWGCPNYNPATVRHNGPEKGLRASQWLSREMLRELQGRSGFEVLRYLGQILPEIEKRRIPAALSEAQMVVPPLNSRLSDSIIPAHAFMSYLNSYPDNARTVKDGSFVPFETNLSDTLAFLQSLKLDETSSTANRPRIRRELFTGILGAYKNELGRFVEGLQKHEDHYLSTKLPGYSFASEQFEAVSLTKGQRKRILPKSLHDRSGRLKRELPVAADSLLPEEVKRLLLLSEANGGTKGVRWDFVVRWAEPKELPGPIDGPKSRIHKGLKTRQTILWADFGVGKERGCLFEETYRERQLEIVLCAEYGDWSENDKNPKRSKYLVVDHSFTLPVTWKETVALNGKSVGSDKAWAEKEYPNAVHKSWTKERSREIKERLNFLPTAFDAFEEKDYWSKYVVKAKPGEWRALQDFERQRRIVQESIDATVSTNTHDYNKDIERIIKAAFDESDPLVELPTFHNDKEPQGLRDRLVGMTCASELLSKYVEIGAPSFYSDDPGFAATLGLQPPSGEVPESRLLTTDLALPLLAAGASNGKRFFYPHTVFKGDDAEAQKRLRDFERALSGKLDNAECVIDKEQYPILETTLARMILLRNSTGKLRWGRLN